MHEILTTSSMNNLVITSKGRKYLEYWAKIKWTNGWLFIDGKKVCKTRKGSVILFHLIDGKIDHFWKIPPKEVPYFLEGSSIDPADWCDVCCET